jgi:hypothetical protein
MMSMDEDTLAIFKRAGDGNRSAGARRIAREWRSECYRKAETEAKVEAVSVDDDGSDFEDDLD